MTLLSRKGTDPLKVVCDTPPRIEPYKPHQFCVAENVESEAVSTEAVSTEAVSAEAVGTEAVGAAVDQQNDAVGAPMIAYVKAPSGELIAVDWRQFMARVMTETTTAHPQPPPQPKHPERHMTAVAPKCADERRLSRETYKRTITWKTRFSLEDLSRDTNGAFLTATLGNAARLMSPGNKIPDYIVPTRVSLIETRSTSKFDLWCDAPWIPCAQEFDTNGVGLHTLHIPEDVRTYGFKDKVLFAMDEETLERINFYLPLLGAKIEDVAQAKKSDDSWCVEPNTTLYNICKLNMTTEEFHKLLHGDVLMLTDTDYRNIKAWIEQDLALLTANVHSVAAFKMVMSLAPAARPGTTVGIKELIGQALADVYDPTYDAKEYYMKKTNIVNVTLNIEYRLVE
jgi:hypothetical protein